MESLLTVLAHKERGRLKVVTVDVDASQALAAAFAISRIPTLVLLLDRRPRARIEGRAFGPQIDAMIRGHLHEAAERSAVAHARSSIGVQTRSRAH
jgi:thioredoxin-like negative regulator of GroEL